MTQRLQLRLLLALIVTVLPLSTARGQTKNLPMKRAAQPTTAAITANDLMSRVYPFADDSMGGRALGTHFNNKGTDYIAAELKRLGLKPAGDNGTYFQDVGVFTRALDPASTLTVDGTAYKAGNDFVAALPNLMTPMSTMETVFGGEVLDTMNILAPDAVRGKLLLLTPLKRQISQEEGQRLLASDGYKRYMETNAAAGATALIGGAALNPNAVRNAMQPTGFGPLRVALKSDKPSALSFTLTAPVGEAILGTTLDKATKGQAGKPVSAQLNYKDAKVPGRNVIAILPGSDPKLRGQYVAVGAHNDHVPFRQQAVDHDSLRAFNTFARKGGVEDAPGTPSPEQWAQINALKDSLRAAHGGIRLDSINNGADDDASGSMGVLEIAEAFATSAKKPKRSIIFVWHTGEERGMYG
jgi:hypothetical protein